MTDLLKLEMINSLPHPLLAHFYGGDKWEIESIDVGSGLMRVFVCGMLQCMHFGNVKHIEDADRVFHEQDDFYHDTL